MGKKLELTERIFKSIDMNDVDKLTDLFASVVSLKDENLPEALRYNNIVMKQSAFILKNMNKLEAYQLWKHTLLFASPYNFDCFCRYIELNREPKKRFYQPRRKQLKVLADALQMLADDTLDLLAISLPPGVGKSTLAIFFLCWTAGREYMKPILGGSHSNSFLRGVYDECLRVIDPEGEYLYHDVFPDVKVIGTNAQNMQIDMGRDEKDAKRFTTLEFSSVGSGNAGKVRAESLLYCDDLVDGIEAALNKERMDKLFQLYATDLRQRKIGGCKELHIATRWSLYDVIGRLQEQYGDSDRAMFIAIPALNEDDESNFDYPISAGFTTQFYHDQREMMDDASWRALYMNEPIERDGQLYAQNELRRFFSLPDAEPDAILAVCDTKDTGNDYCSMPVVYQYNNDYYVADWLFDNSKPEIVEERIVQYLAKNNVQMARFESNSAGGHIASATQKKLTEKGIRTKIQTKYTTSNKETKIIVNSPWVKEHCLFKDDSVIGNDKDYRSAMNQVCGYTTRGKNKHDDGVDSLAQLALYAQSLVGDKVKLVQRPW